MAPTKHRKALDDGRVVTVEKNEHGLWTVHVGDATNPDEYVASAGDSLGSGMIAAALGYDIAKDEWPEWIDEWAEKIEPGAAGKA